MWLRTFRLTLVYTRANTCAPDGTDTHVYTRMHADALDASVVLKKKKKKKVFTQTNPHTHSERQTDRQRHRETETDTDRQTVRDRDREKIKEKKEACAVWLLPFLSHFSKKSHTVSKLIN